MTNEPITDIAHLGHLEILTPTFEASRKFFIDVMGMTQSGEKGSSVYLRAWDDYERYSLKLTASKTSGMAHVAFRTRSPQALERRAAALKGSGFDVGWSDGDLGHGKTFICKDPDGHIVELYYDTEWYDPPPELKPALKNQAQRYPARGCNVRRLDHFNGLAADIKANREFFENYLGFRLTEQIVMDDGSEAGMWMTATNKSYDFAYTRDAHRHQRPLPPRHLCARCARGDTARRRHLPGERRVHRDRPAQARHPADLLPLCLRAGRQPRRGCLRRRATGAGAGLEADPLDRGRAQEGPGLGPADHQVVPHPRHAAGAGHSEIVIAVMDPEVLQADRALVAALASGDKVAATRLLDADFNWVDAEGRIVTAAQRLPPAPLGDEVGLTPSLRIYGEVACVTVDRDRLFVLRLWVKRDSGWRLLVLHEVSQAVPPAPHGPGRKEHDNPCYTLPYAPRSQDQRDCLASWQELEIAVMHHEPEVWAAHVADEFMVVGAARRHSKADRKAVIEAQRRSNTNAAPAPLVWAELVDFPDAIVMRCEHQPFHGKAARVSRVFVKRDGQWLMAVSYQTTRQDAEVKTI